MQHNNCDELQIDLIHAIPPWRFVDYSPPPGACICVLALRVIASRFTHLVDLYL